MIKIICLVQNRQNSFFIWVTEMFVIFTQFDSHTGQLKRPLFELLPLLAAFFRYLGMQFDVGTFCQS